MVLCGRHTGAVDTRSRFERFFTLLDAVPCPPDAEFLYDTATEAGRLRRANLTRYLQVMVDLGTDLIMVGEAPGWRGMSVTGIPFMSVRELDERPGLLTRAAGGDGFAVPARPVARWEASSAVVSKVLRTWRGALPIAWPVYPHHPFRGLDPATNRTPRSTEVKAGLPVVTELITVLGITDVVAFGRKAEGALARVGVRATAVRHPAQGGAAIFEQLMSEPARLRTGGGPAVSTLSSPRSASLSRAGPAALAGQRVRRP